MAHFRFSNPDLSYSECYCHLETFDSHMGLGASPKLLQATTNLLRPISTNNYIWLISPKIQDGFEKSSIHCGAIIYQTSAFLQEEARKFNGYVWCNHGKLKILFHMVIRHDKVRWLRIETKCGILSGDQIEPMGPGEWKDLNGLNLCTKVQAQLIILTL